MHSPHRSASAIPVESVHRRRPDVVECRGQRRLSSPECGRLTVNRGVPFCADCVRDMTEGWPDVEELLP